MPIHGPVLVATDFSTGAAEALRQGQELATGLGTPLSVCHVIPEAHRLRMLFPHQVRADATVEAELRQKAETATRLQVREVLGPNTDAIHLAFHTGSPHAGVLTIAHHLGVNLIVLGPGATALRVARAADRVVLVARPSPPGGAVLGATDFSDPSLPALRTAGAEAARRGAPLRLIHCLDVDTTAYLAAAGAPGLMTGAPFPESAIAPLEADAHQRLQSVGTNPPAETIVRRGSPLSAIVGEATDTPTSLVVVGTHGRSGLLRLALGSVAEHVMRDAPCSVLVVPLARD